MKRLAGVAVAILLSASSGSAQSYLVVVTGLGGEPRYRTVFHEWATTLIDAAQSTYGLPRSHILYLAESAEVDPGRIDGRSTKDNIERALEDLAQRIEPEAQVFILLIGHGAAREGESRFNLPGPDMTATDFASLLARFTSQTIVFVNAASASGNFISALSGANRAVITATKSGFERNETIFARYFVKAFAEDVADVDKNERVSILEAFEYARREVARLFESEGRLLTEHALLDDNADGEGSRIPDADGADGGLARTLFLTRASDASTVPRATADPELAELYRDLAQLEAQIADLRANKAQMDTMLYESELERLLLDLALKSRAIREREGGR